MLVLLQKPVTLRFHAALDGVVEKLKRGAPDLIIRPKVGSFRTLDFLQASAILRASEPAKAELKEKLAALLDGSK